MIALSVNRIRNIITVCNTEHEIITILRKHKIKHSTTVDHGFFQIRIPCRKGYIRIYRTCSRSAPFLVSAVPGFRRSCCSIYRARSGYKQLVLNARCKA